MKNRVRPCLYHHIGLCLAPCAGDVSREEYADMTRRVSLLLDGKSRELIDLLRGAMERAANDLDFERAAVLRDQIRAVEKTVERQGVVLHRGGDMDVIGVVTRPDGLALGMIFVRQGAVLDRSTFFWPGLGLEEADELILSFLSQFYGPHSAVPRREWSFPGFPVKNALKTQSAGRRNAPAWNRSECRPGKAGRTDSMRRGKTRQRKRAFWKH